MGDEPNSTPEQTEPAAQPAAEPPAEPTTTDPASPDTEPAAAATTGDEGAKGAPSEDAKWHRMYDEAKTELDEIKKHIGEAKQSEERTAELTKQLNDATAKLESERLDHALGIKGCVNTKAARALLDDYEGDIDKLAEGAPYLFQQGGKTISSAMPNTGGGDGREAAQIAEINKAMGL